MFSKVENTSDPRLDWVPVSNEQEIYQEGDVDNDVNYDVNYDNNPEAVDDLWNPEIESEDEVYDEEDEDA